MADVETKETKVVSTPEKKVVEDEKEVKKDTPVKEVPKEVEEVDEDSKASENGNGDVKEAKENGVEEEKKTEEKEAEATNGSATNGKSTDAAADVCSIKRKSTGGDVTDDAAAKDVVSPKKAKLDEKPAAVEAETNGA